MYVQKYVVKGIVISLTTQTAFLNQAHVWFLEIAFIRSQYV